MSKKPNHSRLFANMVTHPVLTFITMAVSFVIFGILSVNLATYVTANAVYLITYRWDAVIEGGARQLVEVWLSAFMASGAYLLFKLCESALIQRIAHRQSDAQGDQAASN